MIVGLIGLIGSGKDTVGDILKDEYGFEKESFAKPLKDAISLIFNWDRNLLEGETQESREWREKVDSWWSSKLNKRITPRLVLQMMGTEAGRNIFGNNLWLSSLINRLDTSKDYIITDTRFENEVNALTEIGAKIIRVKRGPDPDWLGFAKYIKSLPKLEGTYLNYLDEYDYKNLNYNIEIPHIHPSEWDWANVDFDYIIKNDGNIEDLKNNVKTFLNTQKG